MITIKKVVAEGQCLWCLKNKECAEIVIDGQQGSLLFCRNDLWKMAVMHGRMAAPTKGSTASKSSD